MIKFSIFEKYSELQYGMSERLDGVMELSRKILNGKDPKNRKAYFKKLKIPYERTIGAFLGHGINVAIVGQENAGKTFGGVDGFITKSDNLFLTVTGSDCFPVYFYDSKAKIIGLVHMGWRSIARNIASKAIEILMGIGSNTEDLLIGIGPGIQVCHFEVKDDALKKFNSHYEKYEHDGRSFLDLGAIIESQILTI